MYYFVLVALVTSVFAQAADRFDLTCDLEYDTNNGALLEEQKNILGTAVDLKIATGNDEEKKTTAKVEDKVFAVEAVYKSNVWQGPADGQFKPTGKDKIEVSLTTKGNKWVHDFESHLTMANYARFYHIIVGDFGEQTTKHPKTGKVIVFKAKRVAIRCSTSPRL